MRNRQKGFSLIELLIVVAIILIIAAIAIPNLLRSKMAANEASAVSTLRTFTTASISYSTNYNAFEPNLKSLGPVAAGTPPSSTTADLVDNELGKDPAVKAGYTFTYTFASGTYTISANPSSPGVTGQRYFFTDPSGVIRVNGSQAATVSDSPLS